MKLVIVFLLFSLVSHSKLLDKISGVINDKVITLSEIKQIQKTIRARKEISPLIYDKKEFDLSDILERVFYNYVIRDKLSAIGYVVSDDSVEGRIQMTEQRLGLSRDDLMKYLRTENLSFSEYFEIIRETMEFNIFTSRVISPLVSITEQEIKNTFYKRNKNNKALGFKYDLVDFYLNGTVVQKNDEKNLPVILKNYRLTGNIPELYKDIESNYIENIAEENLEKELSLLLKETDEGSFSQPIRKNGLVHIFFVKAKNLKESEIYLKERERIKNDLFLELSRKVNKSWFEKEKANYFIQHHI